MAPTDYDTLAKLANQGPAAFNGRRNGLPTGTTTQARYLYHGLTAKQEMRDLIQCTYREKKRGEDEESQDTIFHGILKSDLPPHELRVERLKDEAVSIIGASIASAE